LGGDSKRKAESSRFRNSQGVAGTPDSEGKSSCVSEISSPWREFGITKKELTLMAVPQYPVGDIDSHSNVCSCVWANGRWRLCIGVYDWGDIEGTLSCG
jgi:hypothetical protein